MDESQPLRLRRNLAEPIPAPQWPGGIRLVSFTADLAPEVHALLTLAYQAGEGEIAPFTPWWTALSSDAEYDPTLCFIACDEAKRIVGVAQCWTSAFVKDLAVHPEYRRRGLGAALLNHLFSVFEQRGVSAVDLKVKAGNVRAIRLYNSLGMKEVHDNLRHSS